MGTQARRLIQAHQKSANRPLAIGTRNMNNRGQMLVWAATFLAQREGTLQP